MLQTRDAEAARLKLFLSELLCKDADRQSNIPLYAGPNIHVCFLFHLFSVSFSVSILFFLSCFDILFSHALPRISIGPYLLILEIFPSSSCFLFFFFSSLLLTSSQPTFWPFLALVVHKLSFICTLSYCSAYSNVFLILFPSREETDFAYTEKWDPQQPTEVAGHSHHHTDLGP